MIRIGDKVRFLNEQGGGVVIKLLNDTTVLIEIPEGMEIPAKIKELVVIHQGEAPIVSEKVFDGTSITLNLFRKKPEESQPVWEIKLSNQTSSQVFVSVYFLRGKAKDGYVSSLIGSKTEISLFTLPFLLLHDITGFEIHLAGFEKMKSPLFYPMVKEIKFKPMDFLKNDKLIFDLLKESEQFTGDLNFDSMPFKEHRSIKISKPHSRAEAREVDLHIEELDDNPGLLNNSQKLKIQLDHFVLQLENAIADNCHKIVFIHGVGNGVLKMEIRKILKNYEIVNYSDGSYSKYGFGATEVIIK